MPTLAAAATRHQAHQHLQQQAGQLQWQLQDNERNFVQENKMGAAASKAKPLGQEKDDSLK